MARYRGQKALYEVIGGRARNKSARPVAEPLRPESPKVAKPVIKKVPVVVQTQPKERVVIPEKEAISWKPKPVQCHDGRIEITLSTRAAVMVFLVLMVGLLVCFRMGQWYPGSLDRTFIENSNSVSPERTGLTGLALAKQDVPVKTGPEVPVVDAMKPVIVPNAASRSLTYGNAIVIQEFHTVADLAAVGQFFAARGIGTEVVRKGTTYFLISKARFPYNPEAENTRGSELLQEIRLQGQTYKAPAGLESFAPNKFKGAYGRNIDDQYIGEVTDVH
jgi:hypothetical protein